MSDALHRLSEWVNSTSIDFGGSSGNRGNIIEKPGVFTLPVNFSSGKTGKNSEPELTSITGSENVPVRNQTLKSLDITGITALTAKNNDVGRARENTVPEPPAWPDEPGFYYARRELDRWYEEQRDRGTGLDQDPLVRDLIQRLAGPGLSPYTIRDLAHWYEEEANRRRLGTMIDQDSLDRDLRRLLAERGVFPEFISTEFERVMQVVFPGTTPNPKPQPDPHEERTGALGDAVVVNPSVRDVLRYGDCCPRCGAARWWNASDAPGWRCVTCNPPPIPFVRQVRT
jgi:hypothetical protein